jgi:hypothetical protein|tara:strand:+ start:241 stop:522 length:282 start_codon:yes stop_codon:yes gene_type:complete
MKLTKVKLREIIREEILNESTYIKGKADVVLRLAKKPLLKALTNNLEQSKSITAVADKKTVKSAVKEINKAWDVFEKSVAKANKPLEKNLTGA